LGDDGRREGKIIGGWHCVSV